MRLWHCLLLVLAVAFVPAQPDAALPRPDLKLPSRTPAPTLRGQLLIASPRIGDPRFKRTVILMVRHDRTGALGITVNRPLGERPLGALLKALGETETAGAGNVRVFAGGPVQPEIGFVVHSADYERQGTMRVNTELAVTASLEVLRDIAREKGPRKALLALGYAGWAPGQLEAELARNDWLTAPADPALVFDTPRERVWEEAMEKRRR